VEVRGGSLVLQGCLFGEDKPQVLLGPAVKSAVLMGNQVRGELRVKNESKGQVEMMGNVHRGK